jgi:hypothetical protein
MQLIVINEDFRDKYTEELAASLYSGAAFLEFSSALVIIIINYTSASGHLAYCTNE